MPDLRRTSVPGLMDFLLESLLRPVFTTYIKDTLSAHARENGVVNWEQYLRQVETEHYNRRKSDDQSEEIGSPVHHNLQQHLDRVTRLSDPQNILRILTENQRLFFGHLQNFGYVEGGYASEIRRSGRNSRAHGDTITFERLRRVADTTAYLLDAVAAPREASVARQIAQEAVKRERDQQAARRILRSGADVTIATIAGHLRRVGIGSHSIFSSPRLRRHWAFLELIPLQRMSGEKGLPDSMIKMDFEFKHIGSLNESGETRIPNYVFEMQNRIRVPGKNRNKVYIYDCIADPEDAGGVVTFKCGPTDWHTIQAINKCTDRLHVDATTGSINLDRFPGHLGCSVILETLDNKMLFFQRDRTEHWPNQWSAGIGGSMEWDTHDEPPLGLHPNNTIIKELEQEVGIQPLITRGMEISYLHTGISVADWAYNLFCHAILPAESREICDQALLASTDNEHKYGAIKLVDFTLENCIDLIVSGQLPFSELKPEERKITGWSRLALLYTAIKSFGITNVKDYLRELPSAMSPTA
jgi:hypothetical protein